MLNPKNELEEFDRTILAMRNKIISLEPHEPNSKSMAWIYAILMRSRDKIDVADASLKAKNFVSASLLIRGLIENSAILNGFARRCNKIDWDNGDVYVDEIAMDFILSSRAPSSRKQAVNILTHLEKYATEVNPEIRSTYDALSNRCHPNFEGTFNPFVDVRDGKIVLKEEPSTIEQAAISSCFPISIASVRIEAIKAVGAMLPSSVRNEIENGL